MSARGAPITVERRGRHVLNSATISDNDDGYQYALLTIAAQNPGTKHGSGIIIR
jgi:hypothetical protein